MFKKINGFPFFNLYSLCLISAYFIYFILNALDYFFPVSDLLITLPLIWGFSIWSSHRVSYKEEIKNELDKQNAFYKDLFLINYGFVISTLISFDIRFANTDIRGWAPFILYFSGIFGFFYAYVYSLFSILLKSHQKYTRAFFLLICLFEISINLTAYYSPLSFYRSDKFYYSCIGSILLIHIMVCIAFKSVRFVGHSNGTP